MDNLQVLRYVSMLEQRLKVIENNGPSSVNNSIIPTDLSEVLARLGAVESRPVVDLNEVLARLGAVEARPELSQRLSALELAVTSQNP
jgi:hypothetical protein